MHDTCKEGDYNTKGSPAGKAYPRGAIDSAQEPKTKHQSFSGPPSTPKGTTEKSYT